MKHLLDQLLTGDLEGLEGFEALLKGSDPAEMLQGRQGQGGLSDASHSSANKNMDKDMDMDTGENARPEKMDFQQTIDQTLKNLQSSSQRAQQASKSVCRSHASSSSLLTSSHAIDPSTHPPSLITIPPHPSLHRRTPHRSTQ